MRGRLAKIHQRGGDGQLTPLALEWRPQPDFEAGGAGLYGTAGDYLKFIRMLLNRGQADGRALLKPETVALMSQNQIGELKVLPVRSAAPTLTNDFQLPPDNPHKWGLSFMINTKPLPTGRAAGSLMWAGLANSYYWIDPSSGIGGVYMTQILPFLDVQSFPLFMGFEYAVYQNR
jgi:methyl acetate hydrolase